MPFSDYSTAVVTGASTGMGAAIAERLTKRGLTVHALARNEARLTELADKTGAIAHVVDLTDTAALAAVVGDLDVDVLVNCAGVSRPGQISVTRMRLPTVSLRSWREIWCTAALVAW